jgi:hypothetical protein
MSDCSQLGIKIYFQSRSNICKNDRSKQKIYLEVDFNDRKNKLAQQLIITSN